MVRQIPLNKGQTALIDEEDYPLVGGRKWRAKWNKCTNSWYAVAWSMRINGDRYHISMEREILGLKPGDKRKADHIKSGDTLNNCRSNLRVATSSQNCCNARRRCDNTSGFKGVNWNSAMKKYGARIQVNGKRIWVGWSSKKAEAARLYDIAAIEHHGEFAVLNFPREDYVNG